MISRGPFQPLLFCDSTLEVSVLSTGYAGSLKKAVNIHKSKTSFILRVISRSSFLNVLGIHNSTNTFYFKIISSTGVLLLSKKNAGPDLVMSTKTCEFNEISQLINLAP